MKLDDINAFVAVVNAQSVSQAARDLQLTQPAITRRVQNLEEALGTPLLDRNTKPPKPSAFGLQVYDQCQAVLHEVARLSEIASADREPSGPLRLGLTQGIADIVLRDAVEDLRRGFPAVSTSVCTGWGAQLVERVNQGELDAAAMWLGSRTPLPKNTRGELIARDPLAAVPLSDFKPEVDLWLVQTRAPGALRAPIERFGAHVRRGLAPAQASARVTRAAAGRRAA